MSEQTSTAVAGEQKDEQGKEEAKGFEAITSQEELDRIIQARVARERAKLPTDYDELKAAAAKLAEIEEANKTEAQKEAERRAELERENAELKVGKLRAEVAAAKGVPSSLLTGGTKEELEAAADALIEFRGEQPKAESEPEKQTYVIPDEGGIPAIGKADNISPGMGTLRAAYSQERVS
ncbi:hypothetical protein [Cryobacterium sp. BB736]|uniref:hypothetical protein n=1 Tax=Cryobacterium sp. BB736 TaxID=2746963 RepID=UPI0018738594|nr:hypothetical protein [Cryobacterium sp. BB736]